MSRILTTDLTIKALEDKMRESNKVFFVRFGDNDIFQMLGHDLQGKSIYGKPLGNNMTLYSEKQRDDIRRSFNIKGNDYMKAVTLPWDVEDGMANNVFGSKKPKKLELMVDQLSKEIYFYQPVVFHYLAAFKPKRFKAFLSHVRPMRKLFIGRVGKSAAEKLLGPIDVKITSPKKNAYTAKEEVLDAVKEGIGAFDIELVVSCAGQLTRAMAHDLWNMNRDFHYIDLGSVIDLTEGRFCRKWHQLKGNDIIKNFNL